ncbi:MAG: hypothetical protein HKM00_03000 [Gallionella sp.]|nr:hypothetical protein [Gallionella sp.]
MNSYIIIGGLLLWIASLIGVGSWQNDAGHTAERVVWQAKDNQELTAANAEILSLEEAARAAQQQHIQSLADIATQFEKEKQDAQIKANTRLAQYRAGAFRLRDPSAVSARTCGNQTGQIATSTGGSDGGSPGELSGSASEFLLGLTGEADEVVRQLSACQAVVIEDRKE